MKKYDTSGKTLQSNLYLTWNNITFCGCIWHSLITATTSVSPQQILIMDNWQFPLLMEATELIFKFPLCASAAKGSLWNGLFSVWEYKHDLPMRNECAFFRVLKRKSSFYTESKPQTNKQTRKPILSLFI